ncbi:MAG: YcxB family protein [Thermodesulfobacteriota bacterium]|nr:YcxB family protein [Thermodesulfobacteriota bacterium]
MSQKIVVKYDLSEKDWRTFYNTYYSSDKRFKLRFIYGTGSWIVGVCGLLGLFDNQLIAFGMIAFGLYCVFAKQYLVNKAVKKVKAKPQFPGKIDYTIDQDKFSGIEQELEFEFNWETFYGYRDAAPGLLLYLKEASFFFIPNEAISIEDKQDIINFLRLNMVLDLTTK